MPIVPNSRYNRRYEAVLYQHIAQGFYADSQMYREQGFPGFACKAQLLGRKYYDLSLFMIAQMEGAAQ